jgi:hypothetical protein
VQEETAMPAHQLAPTTRTLDMLQIAQINERLATPGGEPVTPEALAMPDRSAGPLQRVSWEGAPEFPYIYAHFAGAADGEPVLLHTPALVRLSHLLGLHHRWGV